VEGIKSWALFSRVVSALLAKRCVDHVAGISLTGIPFLCFVITRRETYLASFLCVCRSFSLAVFERNDLSSAIPSLHVDHLLFA